MTEEKKIRNVGDKSVSGTDFRHLNRLGAPTQDKDPVTNSPDPPPHPSCEEVGIPGKNLQTHGGHADSAHKRPLGVKLGTFLPHLNRNLSEPMVLGQPVMLPVFQNHFQNRTHNCNK